MRQITRQCEAGSRPGTKSLFDLAGAEGLDGMRDESGNHAEKTLHVREFGVGVEGGFVEPLGLDGEGKRRTERFEKVNAQATGFGAGGGNDAKQLVTESLLFAGSGLEATKVCRGMRVRTVE